MRPSGLKEFETMDHKHVFASIYDQIQFGLTRATIETLRITKSIQPYSVMAPLASYHHRDAKYHTHLSRVMEEDAAEEKPFRSALVINKELGRPGAAFFEKARQLGHTIPNTEADEIAFWKDQLKKLGVQ